VRSYSFFTDRLEEEIARAHRYEQPLTLALIDLDGFKAVNDTLGHVVGDDVLREVAALMQSNIRRIDVLARFGGDEFSLLLPNTNIAGAKIVCERLRSFVAHSSFAKTEAGQITLSIGLCGLPDHSIREGGTMIKLSDDALYDAKKAGGNCFSVAPAGE
jgi:diguanylate cyclase (GGDEF)-like protein